MGSWGKAKTLMGEQESKQGSWVPAEVASVTDICLQMVTALSSGRGLHRYPCGLKGRTRAQEQKAQDLDCLVDSEDELCASQNCVVRTGCLQRKVFSVPGSAGAEE